MLKILNISLEKKLFVDNSEAQKRHQEYGLLCEELHVLVLTRNNDKKICRNVWLYGTEGKNKLICFYLALKKAKKIIHNNKINLISTQDPFFAGLMGWLLKRRFKIPLQIQIHTDFLSPYFWQESLMNKIRVLLAKFLLPSSDGIRVVSERIRRSVISTIQYPKSKIMVLPIFVDVKKLQEMSVKTNLHKKYPQFDFIILMASRLSKEKNIELAIGAMVEIIKKHPKTGLIIVGTGKEESYLKLQIKNYKVDNNVIMETNWRDDLSSYYKTADLFLLTSNYEGYGRSVIEAAVCNLPIVMTNVGCAYEIIKDGENGLIVAVNDKEALIEAILSILEKKIKLQPGVRQFATKEEYLKKYQNSWKLTINNSKHKIS